MDKKPVVWTRQRFVKKTFEICPIAYPYFLPEKAKQGSIGYDLVCPVDFHVPAHSRVAVPLNFAINLPLGIEAKIEARSGMTLRGMEGYGTRVSWGWKWGFIPWKKTESGKINFDADVMPGKIDPNFTDGISVLLKNNDVAFTIPAGTRIAQMTFYETRAPFFEVVTKLSCKSRGGGFGSSGTTAKSGAVKMEEVRKTIFGGLSYDGGAEYERYVRLMKEHGLEPIPHPTLSHLAERPKQDTDRDQKESERVTFDEWFSQLSPEKKEEVRKTKFYELFTKGKSKETT